MPVIAVDGPAASGKGTIARALARHFHLPHLDTGGLYRAVGLMVLRATVDPGDIDHVVMLARQLDLSLLDDPALRDDRTADMASRISVHPPLRQALLALQRNFAGQPGGAVLDGRDIATVIVPHAPAKLFITASPEVRARRRFLELKRAGSNVTPERILADIVARDERDRARATAPLVQAADAVLLDTSELDIETAVRQAIGLVGTRLRSAGRATDGS